MGWLNNTSKFRLGVGEKVKNVGQVVGTLKGLYDVGKTIYGVAKAVAPIAATLF